MTYTPLLSRLLIWICSNLNCLFYLFLFISLTNFVISISLKARSFLVWRIDISNLKTINAVIIFRLKGYVWWTHHSSNCNSVQSLAPVGDKSITMDWMLLQLFANVVNIISIFCFFTFFVSYIIDSHYWYSGRKVVIFFQSQEDGIVFLSTTSDYCFLCFLFFFFKKNKGIGSICLPEIMHAVWRKAHAIDLRYNKIKKNRLAL